MFVRKYVDRNGLAAMLATKRSAGITPEVCLMILLHAGNKAHKLGDPPPLWNPGQTSAEVRPNKGISGLKKGLMSSKNIWIFEGNVQIPDPYVTHNIF